MTTTAKGSITAVRNHGTIVELVLDSGDPVYFDHRRFQHLWEAEGGNLQGRPVELVRDADWDSPVLLFLDEVPA